MDITSEQLLQFDFTNAHISSLLQKQKTLVLPTVTLKHNDIATQHYVKQHIPHSK